jgi:hypothetical protein
MNFLEGVLVSKSKLYAKNPSIPPHWQVQKEQATPTGKIFPFPRGLCQQLKKVCKDGKKFAITCTP